VPPDERVAGEDRPWERWLTRDEAGRSGDGPVDPEPPPWGEDGRSGPTIWSVSALTRAVRDVVRSDGRFRDLWVEGEVGQTMVSAAGHAYFTMLEGRTQLSCVFFRNERLASPFEPQTGLRMVAHGRLDVYEAQGAYQLYVDALQPAGFGDLALRFEALKAKLAAEGLFDASRRRPLPHWPRVIGVVTSVRGAVLHDIRQVLARRWPLVRLVVSPCQVQGSGAPPSIVSALERLARWTDPATGRPVDVAIVARGGGSLEDLWPFNDEDVVRAVAAFPIPLVSGVGHETDVTLVDFAADVRAPTPSAAAELVVPAVIEERSRLQATENRLAGAMMRTLSGPRATLASERRALSRLHPRAQLGAERLRAADLLDRVSRAAVEAVAARRTRLGRAGDALPHLGRTSVERARADLASAGAGLSALSPFGTLGRGYAIVRDDEGRVVRDAAAAPVGSHVDIRLARGGLDARVERVRPT